MSNKIQKTMRKAILIVVAAILLACLSEQFISCNQQPRVEGSDYDERANQIDYYIDTVVGHVILSTVIRDKSGNFAGISSIEIRD